MTAEELDAIEALLKKVNQRPPFGMDVWQANQWGRDHERDIEICGEALIDAAPSLLASARREANERQYGYGIVDKNGKPFWAEACVCEDIEPMRETCDSLNEDAEDDPRAPYRVVELIAKELDQ